MNCNEAVTELNLTTRKEKKMETYLLITSAVHTGCTTAFRGRVYDNHPSHDGELLFQLNGEVTVSEEHQDITFDKIYASAFKTIENKEGNIETYRNGQFVDPYHMKNAMEMVLQHLESGEIERLEDFMLLNEEMAVMKY